MGRDVTGLAREIIRQWNEAHEGENGVVVDPR